MEFLKTITEFFKSRQNHLVLIGSALSLILVAGLLLFMRTGVFKTSISFVERQIFGAKEKTPVAKTTTQASKGKPQEAPRAAPATDRVALVKEALELSGAKQQMDQYPELFKNQLRQRQADIDPRLFEKLSKIIAETFPTDTFYQSVIESFQKKFNEKHILDVLDFLHSPLARKVAQIEVESSNPKAAEEIQKFVGQLQTQPPAKERLALIERLDRASAATELAVQTVLIMSREMAKGAYLALPPEEREKQGPLEPQLEPLLKEAKAQIEAPIKKGILVNYLFTYRTVSDPDLAKYIEFYETEHGRWFTRVATEGLMHAMAATSEKFGKEVVKLGKEAAKLAPGRKHQAESRYSAAGKRDPFQPIALKPKASQRPRENLSPLERYEIGQLKLVGIVWDIQEPRAMVEDSAGLGFIIKVGTPIGPNDGKVKAISPMEVFIEEVHTDFYGERRNREIGMKLAPE